MNKCQTCDKELPVGSTSRRKYCDGACRERGRPTRKAPTTVICIVCGTPAKASTGRRKYCSDACRSKASEATRKKNRSMFTCQHCGVEAPRDHSRRKYCSDGCREAGRDSWEKSYVSKYTRGRVGTMERFLDAPVENKPNPCCGDASPELYREDDATNPDIWDAPTHGVRDGLWVEFSDQTRYILHERKFFHALGIHDDERISRMLGITYENLSKLLKMADLERSWKVA
jgi:hypothetical protein